MAIAADRAIIEGLADQLQQTYARLLDVLDSGNDETLHRRMAASAPSMAFHVWHAARIADRFGARLPGLLPNHGSESGAERWEADAVAERWNLDSERLGAEQNAKGLSDEDAEQIQLPGREELHRYAVEAFAGAQSALDLISDDDLGREVIGFQGQSEPLAATVCAQLQHAARHLGMIEALRGVMGERGTATA